MSVITVNNFMMLLFSSLSTDCEVICFLHLSIIKKLLLPDPLFLNVTELLFVFMAAQMCVKSVNRLVSFAVAYLYVISCFFVFVTSYCFNCTMLCCFSLSLLISFEAVMLDTAWYASLIISMYTGKLSFVVVISASKTFWMKVS